MGMYLVAVKRERRQDISLAEAIDAVRDLPGLSVVDDPTQDDIVRVWIPDDSLDEVAHRISQWCHIEQEVEHFPQPMW